MMASLKAPSKPEEWIPTEIVPETDLSLPRKSIEAQHKPEEELAEDPAPCPYEVDDMQDPFPYIMKQDSKKTPRSSYYQWHFPEGLPKDHPASPNRRLHETRQAAMKEFMTEMQQSPTLLKREICARRGEPQRWFEPLVDFLRCN